MKKGELEVLQIIAVGAGSEPFPRAWFDTYPHKRATAMRLMWGGYLELEGAEGVVLTSAGMRAMAANQ